MAWGALICTQLVFTLTWWGMNSPLNEGVFRDVQKAIWQYKKQQELEYAEFNEYYDKVALIIVLVALLFFTCVCIGMKASKEKKLKTEPETKKKD